MTDWWSTHPLPEDGETLTEDPESPEAPPMPLEPPPVLQSRVISEPEPTTPAARSPRGKAVKIVGGLAGAIVAGTLILNGISGGGDEGASAATSFELGSSSPSAEGGSEEEFPAAGGGPAEIAQTGTSASAPQNVVTLTAKPTGKGRVGAIVKVSIRNGTSKPLTILATLIEGDDRPAVVGEGTLAPGSRIVEPGEIVEGTVEFASNAAPHQIILVDLSGNIMAASKEA